MGYVSKGGCCDVGGVSWGDMSVLSEEVGRGRGSDGVLFSGRGRGRGEGVYLGDNTSGAVSGSVASSSHH